MRPERNRPLRPTDYKKDRKRAVTTVALGLTAAAAGLVLVVTALFFFMDSSRRAMESQARETWFDPWEKLAWDIQDSYKTLEVVALSYDFATDFKETYHYYFAFDREGYPYIVKMKGELNAGYQVLVDYLFGDETMEEPEPVKLRGVAAPIEEDIREFAIESMNDMYDEEILTESNFEDYIGFGILDTTQKPMGSSDVTLSYALGSLGAVFLVLGLIAVVSGGKRKAAAELALEKQTRTLAQMSSYVSDAPSINGEGDLQTLLEEKQKAEDRSSMESITKDLEPERKSNVFLGIIGALGGSLTGVALWLVLGFVGFIAGIAGFVMLKFALLGYQKLSGKLDKKGALISLFIAAFMVFGANVLDYVISMCKAYFEFEASWDTVCFVVMNFWQLMSEHEQWGGFFMNLVIGYGLSIWASCSLIRSILQYREQ